jgi:hypothetical protein
LDQLRFSHVNNFLLHAPTHFPVLLTLYSVALSADVLTFLVVASIFKSMVTLVFATRFRSAQYGSLHEVK